MKYKMILVIRPSPFRMQPDRGRDYLLKHHAVDAY